MALHPVILCGGSGVRLWPLSNARRSKPFIPLVDGQSTFAQTLARLAAIDGAAAPIVVAGPAHVEAIEAEFAAAGVEGVIIVEPVGRDSAPAMAAAAHYIQDRHPGEVALFLAADHHIPDPKAYAATVAIAVAQAALGSIVTLGVRPSGPSTAYGYIAPGAPLEAGAYRVEGFAEKPDEATAQAYLDQGRLWNGGMFIVRPDVLIAELQAHAPAINQAARAALDGAQTLGRQVRLGEAFAGAPKLSIDYAVMEHTALAAVAPADFAWSDLGAWDAVLAVSRRDEAGNNAEGAVVLTGAENCLVRAEGGVKVVAVGVRNLAIIAGPDGVMVCDLDALDQIKDAVGRLQDS
ncbi:mannose-1-phosphate guanylyltransferase/mannose-6-phosphate isomerase [Caulobacter ginsengisoli]|uniref:Mannose-1-phosphate guanylyltransferase/mannose-6-phosphate isomerase n=1 Tax=Caulobacter ginsengisoli TaxID=400775 RepID=A0ABU0IM92_9CAUL|nr:mannose-1-phosphate guanylyltransferase [Caulobacter ginsengisoli]MDQ0463136.1 mannose-1-phosphate guanylyltransferase/mannose-6-phosphate isomerase [Caulobacter ginsengisoli]